jgi:hypothetical protein
LLRDPDAFGQLGLGLAAFLPQQADPLAEEDVEVGTIGHGVKLTILKRMGTNSQFVSLRRLL